MTDQNFSLSDFDYHLPESLIAQKPADPRDHSRLLVYNRQNGSITDDFFYNFANHLPENSTLVLNNSRVEKVRLLFGKKEVFITRVIDPYTVEAIIRPGKRFRTGKTVTLIDPDNQTTPDNPTNHVPQLNLNTYSNHGSHTDRGSRTDHTNHSNPSDDYTHSGTTEQDTSPRKLVRAEVLHTSEDGLRTLRFNYPVNHPIFDPYRHTPFPPYIKPDENLAGRYQTIFARDKGSKAAPTAGLHFTDHVFSELKKKSVQKIELTLHVGLGTFALVKTESIQEHKMHSEWYQITPEATEALRKARFITAVGTTSARVLESAAEQDGYGTPGKAPFRDFQAHEQETDIFITPGYQFRAVDALLTNFHLPKSTLLMMVSAFIGIDEMHRIYRHAIHKKYRFYSFGDAMLLL